MLNAFFKKIRIKLIYSDDKKAISLMITILIISSILVSTITVGDIIIRHSKTVKGSEFSENAYLAAESALEKVNYDILKNYDNISSYATEETVDMSNGATYEVTNITLDNRAPFVVTLGAGESFELALDFNGTNIYPASITINKDGSASTDLMIYECITTETSPRVCASGYVQTFKSLLPYSFNVDEEEKYYKIRINNLDASSPETYTLTPSDNLPVGVDITVKGIYEGYERQAKSSLPKWQTFGIDQ